MDRCVMVLTVGLLAGTAAARPPPDRDHECDHEVACWPDPAPDPDRPAAEWSTWFRLGFGVEPAASTTAARATTPVSPRGHQAGWDAAVGADLTMAVSESGDVRFGPWIEARGLSVIGGAELVVQRVPRKLDMFLYEGQGVLALRAGANYDRVTAQLAYGYLAPWKLWGPWRGSSRYMIGVRFVGTVTRAIDDPRDWSATVGLEAEPFGAIRYLLGIRSWY